MMKTLDYPEAVQALLVNYLECDRETVAFMVGDADTGRVRGLWGTDNLFEETGDRGPDRGFAIGKTAWAGARAEAARQGVAILGVLHSHLYANPWPSFWDYRALTKGAPWGAVFHSRGRVLVTFTKRATGAGGVVTAVHNLDLGPVLAALADLTIAEGETSVDWQGTAWTSAGRLAVPDTPELVDYARGILITLTAPGADLADVDPARVADLAAAVEAATVPVPEAVNG